MRFHGLALQRIFSLLIFVLAGCNSQPSAAFPNSSSGPSSTTSGSPATGGSGSTISGSISPATGGSGAIVTITGSGSGSTVADGSGHYNFTGLANGTYTLTPSNRNLVFSPPSQSVTITDGSIASINFTLSASSSGFSISGTISPPSSGAGATVTLSGGASLTTAANGAGIYIFEGVSPGSYRVTPRSQIATFSPTSKGVTVSGSSVSAVDFTATASSNIVFFDNFAGTSLGSAWTVISRHGEYAQNETECNVPQQVAVANGLTITTVAQPTTCGDFNVDRTVRHPTSTWPYVTGDIQWASLNFTFGTFEIRGKFPDQGTSLWPAFWLLGSNCQSTNPYTADTGYSTCPDLGTSGYTEIDMTECYISGGWCQFHVANPGFGIGNGCDAVYSVDTNWHTFRTVWNSSSIKQYMDGVLETTCNQSLSLPMFLLMQTQTGGVGGTPNNALLPANLEADYVRVTQP